MSDKLDMLAVKLLQKLTAMYAPRVASELREDEAAANYWEERRRQCVYRAALMAYCVDDLRTMRVHDEPAITGADRMTIDAALMFCETARDDAIDLALEAHMHQYLQPVVMHAGSGELAKRWILVDEDTLQDDQRQ